MCDVQVVGKGLGLPRTLAGTIALALTGSIAGACDLKLFGYCIAGWIPLVLLVLLSHRGTRRFHRLCSRGDREKVHAFLKRNSQNATRLDDMGVSPLQYAARFGRETVVAVLLRHGANMDFGISSTPLIEAVFRGHLGVCRQLLKNGADPNGFPVKVRQGPLHVVAFSRQRLMDVAAELLRAGASVSARDEYMMTPLHCAASVGHCDLVRFLIEHGADPCAKDQTKRTAGQIAERTGFDECASLLYYAESLQGPVRSRAAEAEAELTRERKRKDGTNRY